MLRQAVCSSQFKSDSGPADLDQRTPQSGNVWSAKKFTSGYSFLESEQKASGFVSQLFRV
jgi:hypothetical protein